MTSNLDKVKWWVNAGGLIAVYDEYENQKNDNKRIRNKVLTIKKRLSGILERSKKENLAPHRIANQMAQKKFNSC